MQSNSATRYEDDYSQITFCKESNPASSWTYHSVACTVTTVITVRQKKKNVTKPIYEHGQCIHFLSDNEPL